MLLPARKEAFTYVEAHSSLRVAKRESRGSQELWGDECDHSVMKHYYNNMHIHTHCIIRIVNTNTQKVACLYKISCGILPACKPPPLHLYTSGSLRWSPTGTSIFLHQHLSPGSCGKKRNVPPHTLTHNCSSLWMFQNQPARITQHLETNSHAKFPGAEQ